MKLYEVEFDASCFRQVSENKALASIPFKWRKDSNYPGYVYNPKMEGEQEQQKQLAADWEALPIEEVMTKHPNKVGLPYGERSFILSPSQYETCFTYCKLKNVIDVDAESQVQAIDLEALANKVADRLGSNLKQLFNQKLEIHQPNMPLFTYNSFIVVDNMCAESLQTNYIDKGWRVVCVCPQPDQRRPDYILGKFDKEKQ